MNVFIKRISISTGPGIGLINITDEVEKVLREANVNNGLCVIYTPHTTTAIIVNEDEYGLKQDIIGIIKEFFKPGGDWHHNRVDMNAHAHLGAIFLGSARVIPVANGKLGLGIWQNIFLVEMDGPRRRNVDIIIIGN